MSRVKRPTFLSVYFERRPLLDVGAMLTGRVEVEEREEAVAVTLLDREEHLLSADELTALMRIPSSEWTPVEEAVGRLEVEPDVLEELVHRGLLLSDRDAGPEADLARRDAALARQAWHRHAALYHYTSRWPPGTDVLDLGERSISIQEAVPETAEVFDELVENHGKPPETFLDRSGAGSMLRLPRTQGAGELFDLLARRRTTRLFDRRRPVSVEQLSILLSTVFGCQGTTRLSRDVEVLRKTSPSGGGLHPIEVYPLISAVEGVAPGIYHYSVRRHGLEPVRGFSSGDEAREAAERYVRGQRSLASAHVLFLLTARFYRNFWKYRDHGKVYRVLHLDAGHLSQTLYLSATALGLGAFITAAISEVAIDEALGLDGIEEGALAVCGCGAKPAEGPALSLETEPYWADPPPDATVP